MISKENFFEEQYIVHQFTKVIRSKRYLFSKNLDEIKHSDYPELFDIDQQMMKDLLGTISKEKRERFAKRGGLYFC
jgi:hypothetical protein